MKVDLIVLAIPVFFVLMALEMVVARLYDRDLYRLSDTVNDLSCGIVSQLAEALFKTALFAGYMALYERARLFDLPATAWWVWATCFVGVDFLYYWFHRASHEVAFLWAAHVVHHQSEDYNLAVALRQGTLQGFFSWTFYLPLALLGFPPLVFLAVSSLDTLYQFWIHTRLVRRLGPLETVLNTPSHHRVHHGRNPLYIDRNHAGVLIVWDRLFGTFQEEREEPVYGITTPLRSWNPLWANVHVWAELVDKARRTARWRDKVLVFLKPPGWSPPDLGGYQPAPEVDRATYRKWDSSRSRSVDVYATVQFVLVLAATAVFLNVEPRLARVAVALGAVYVVASLVALGGLLEARGWAFGLEAGRLVLLAAAAWATGLGPGVAGAVSSLALLSLGGLAVAWRSGRATASAVAA